MCFGRERTDLATCMEVRSILIPGLFTYHQKEGGDNTKALHIFCAVPL